MNQNSAVVLQKHRHVQTWLSKFHYCITMVLLHGTIVCTRIHWKCFLHQISYWSWKYVSSIFIITLAHLTPLHPSLIHKTRKRVEDKVLTNTVLDTKWAFYRSLNEHINKGINIWVNTFWPLSRSFGKYPPSTLA